jgi:hypothetical protein
MKLIMLNYKQIYAKSFFFVSCIKYEFHCATEKKHKVEGKIFLLIMKCSFLKARLNTLSKVFDEYFIAQNVKYPVNTEPFK